MIPPYTLQSKGKSKKQKSANFCSKFADFLVRLMGLEPIRSPTRPSNVRVCLFRHNRILYYVRNSEHLHYTCFFFFVNTFFEKMPVFFLREIFVQIHQKSCVNFYTHNAAIVTLTLDKNKPALYNVITRVICVYCCMRLLYF